MSGFLTRLLAARERWLTLDDTREVKIRRPPEARLPALVQGQSPEAYAECVVDWRGAGFTEAGILGPKHGGDAPVPFDAAVWRELALDNVRWIEAVARAVVQDATAFLEQREAAEKK